MIPPEEHDGPHAMPDAEFEQAIPLARPAFIPAASIAARDAMLLGHLSAGRAALHLVILFLVLALYILVVGVAIGIALGASGESEAAISQGVDLAVTLIGEALLVSVAFLLLRNRGHRPRAIGASSSRWGVDAALGLAVTAISFGVFICSVYGMAVLWPEGFAEMTGNWEHVEAMLPPLSLGGAFVLMLIIGTLEELIFRGILLTHLRRLTRSWVVAAVLSGAIFASLHLADQATAAVVPLFLVSLVWSGFTIWRRSLVPSIIGHALFNFLQFASLTWAASNATANVVAP